MLQLAGEKMSKSLGNLVTIDEFLQPQLAGCAAHADLWRPLSQTGHLHRRDAGRRRAQPCALCAADCARPRAAITTGEDADALRIATEEARGSFIAAMDDDFNTSSALALNL